MKNVAASIFDFLISKKKRNLIKSIKIETNKKRKIVIKLINNNVKLHYFCNNTTESFCNTIHAQYIGTYIYIFIFF